MRSTAAIVLFGGLTGAASAFPPGTLLVNAAAPPGGDGLTWATAFNSLGAAITAADAIPAADRAHICIAQGTYTPTNVPDPAGATFDIHRVMDIYGGFVGTETEFSQADPVTHITILSGGGLATRIMTVHAGCTIRGLSFRSGGPGALGGALTVLGTTPGSSPLVTNCTFTQNSGGNGAAISVAGGSPSFSNCVIGPHTLLVGAKGAVYLAAPAFFTDCTFTGNSGALADAGAVRLQSSGLATFRHCAFASNSAPDQVGGAINGDGASFFSCTFSGNSAIGGGAVWGGSHLFFSCAFVGNTSIGTTGVVHGTGNRFLNCTLRGNTALAQQGGSGAGAVSGLGSTLTNCILWGNCGPACGTEAAQISGSATIAYSSVQGWTGSYGGAGNDGIDPVFADSAGRLSPGSHAIDSGDSGIGFYGITAHGIQLDADNGARYFDAPEPNTGISRGRPVDRGAFEFGAPPYTCYANVDYSTATPLLNVLDFNTFLNLFAAGSPVANCDAGINAPLLNVLDFNCFLNTFAAGCSSP
jgi:hypothetical protein